MHNKNLTIRQVSLMTGLPKSTISDIASGDRTLSVESTLRKIYTDKNTRIRLNLEKIIELRNISTHYITEDYEVKYAPLFQACVLNFVNEIQRFHGVDITKHIAQNFLTISARYEPLTNEAFKMNNNMFIGVLGVMFYIIEVNDKSQNILCKTRIISKFYIFLS